MKKSKGITLIALIVTIIVLLVLAGISITMILGDNGILNKAKTAKENSNAGDIEEQNRLGLYNDAVDKYTTSRGTVTLSEEQYNSILSRLDTLESSRTQKVLWSGSAQATGTYMFQDASDDISNYKYILIERNQGKSAFGKNSEFFESSYLQKNNQQDIRITGYSTRYTDIHFIDHGFVVDTISAETSTAYIYVEKIIGINF